MKTNVKVKMDTSLEDVEYGSDTENARTHMKNKVKVKLIPTWDSVVRDFYQPLSLCFTLHQTLTCKHLHEGRLDRANPYENQYESESEHPIGRCGM